MNIESKISLVFSFGRSLLDEITNSLRAAAVRVEGSIIYVSYFFNCDVTKEIREHYESADSEVYAPVPMEVFAPTLFVKKTYPDSLPDVGLYVFSRDTLLPKQIDPQELKNLSLYVRIKIAIYQILLGRIPATLKAVRFENNEDTVVIIFSVDPNSTSHDFYLLREGVDEFRQDFPGLVVKEDFEIGKDIPQVIDYVFMRCRSVPINKM